MNTSTTITPIPNDTSDLIGRDIITIKNLQLPHGIIAPDVWGKPKEQPALVSLTLHLHGDGFNTAADKDKLDNSTIHYGQLAKTIRSSVQPGQNPGDLSNVIEQAICSLALKSDGHFIVARSTVDVSLPKASMDGEGVTIVNVTNYDMAGKTTSVSRIFSIEKIKIMTLIGVNSYERGQKQPLVVSILLHLGPETEMGDSQSTVALFNLEATVVQIVENTSFETLETLADFTVSQLKNKMLDSGLPGTSVQLRIEKPRAIAWADAPAVEIIRDVPHAKSKRPTRTASTVSGNVREATPADVSRELQRLSVVKPYSA